jgi:hypothetical protein
MLFKFHFLTLVLALMLSCSLALPVPTTDASSSQIVYKRQKNFEDDQEPRDPPPTYRNVEDYDPSTPRHTNFERLMASHRARSAASNRPANPPIVIEPHPQRSFPMLTRPRPHLSFLHRLMHL